MATKHLWKPRELMCRVDPETGCWSVISHRASANGYVRVIRNGRQSLVHRLIYEQAHGLIPDGLCVCHRCDTRDCINIEHLFLGTVGDNNRDCSGKGRHACGEQTGGAQLTEDQVREVRRLVASGASQAQTARTFGVVKGTVAHIIHRRTWKHMEAEHE